MGGDAGFIPGAAAAVACSGRQRLSGVWDRIFGRSIIIFFLRFGGEGKNIDCGRQRKNIISGAQKSAVGDLPQYERGKIIVSGDFIFLSPERGHLL